LGKATKIDIIVRMDVKALLARTHHATPENITGCVDDRTVDQILTSRDHDDPIKAFKLPPNHFGQEPRFVPRRTGQPDCPDTVFSEEDGYLIFYVFNEDQLDEVGECRADAKSELWVLNAKTMQDVVCKIKLPTRVPYGLHGNWFSEQHIERQRKVEALRSVPELDHGSFWSRTRGRFISYLG
jgi:hypothetical protein